MIYYLIASILIAVTALFAGAAGWLHFRQKQEGGPDGPADPGA